VLPVGLATKGLLYADGTSLLAETVEELNTVLQVRQAWADQNDFVFSVEKSKATVRWHRPFGAAFSYSAQ